MKLTIGIAACVLALGLGFQQLRIRNVKGGDLSTPRVVELSQRVPLNLPGWTGRDEPLGETELVKSKVETILNYDDVLNRVYQKGSVSLGVYAAYWSPGRMPVAQVASHTPDRCWTENGWRCLDMRFAEPVQTPTTALSMAQWRLFEPPGGTGPRQFVLYWHLVGDKLHDYGARFNAAPHPLHWWRDTLKYALSGSDGQYFIRVTSNRDFSELAGDPGWEQLVEALASMGLRRSDGAQ